MSSEMLNERKHKTRLSDFLDEPKRLLTPIKGFEEYEIISLEKSVEPLKSLLPEIDQMLYIIKDRTQNPSDGLTTDESGSIMLYSMEWTRKENSFYYLLNKVLRSENRQMVKPWFSYLRLFLHSLSKLKSFEQTIYRGIKLDLTDDYPIGKEFVWWAFSSCTDSIQTLENEDFFGKTGKRTLFLIECHTGKDIRNHSFFSFENEILLCAARQFQVISNLNAGNDLHLIQIKEIQPPFPFISNSPSIPINSLSKDQQKLQQFIEKHQDSSEIDFENRNLKDDHLEFLIDEMILRRNSSKLLLGFNEITSKGCFILSNMLFWNRNLQELILYHNSIGDEGLKHLSQINSSLKILSIGSNGITDLGMKYVSQMFLHHRSLIVLGLVSNQITDRGIEILSQSISSSKSILQILHLSKNPFITDGSIDCFIQMIQSNHSLKELWIQNCHLTDNGKRRLKSSIQSNKHFRLEF